MRFETKPAIAGENFGLFAGAYWTAWVVSDDPQVAMERAVDYASARGWQFERGGDIHVVERSHHAGDDGLLERFDAAQRDGIAVVIDTFKRRISESN
jgi:hypothetical protein